MRFLKAQPAAPRGLGKPWQKRMSGWGRASAAILLAAGLGSLAPGSPASAQSTSFGSLGDGSLVRESRGIHMLEYSPIRLTNGGEFDLLAIHQLYRLNDWLSFGVGAFAPMLRGNAGGFFGASARLHAQRRISGNWFVNGGLSFGAGAGGASIANIGTLSGDGVYARAYAGIGYAFRNFRVGLNYSRVAIANSPINDSTFSIFVQRPFSLRTGAYSSAGTIINANDFNAPAYDTMISVSAGNMVQINPTGSYRGDIGLLTTQFTSFFRPNVYSFFGINMGASGLSWYNQAQGGVGFRYALSPNVNVYSQLGIGSGGWVTDTINTGSGIVIYPRVALEYRLSDRLGAQLSAGYLYAPRGTSRNWTVELGMNYYLANARSQDGDSTVGDAYTMRGISLNVFGRRTSDIFYNGRTSAPLSMIAVQADYALNDNWYAAGQLAVAANRFRGFAGYAEAFLGVGYRRNLTSSGRFQGYAQLMLGVNDLGVDPAHENGPMLYPSIGVNYNINDRLSLYGQLGVTRSINQYLSNGPTVDFENYSIGLGMTYRFSLLTR
tara:strand:- start:18351 stop:20000 length:1650 start_codon:yes stop_codon:yes gene_type:complete